METTLTLEGQRALDVAETEALLRSVLIPPRPTLLVAVLEEQGKPDPDLDHIAELISEDVALAASTLKLVNSPLFGLARPVVDIRHAVRMLGLKNISGLITGLLLHQAFRNLRGASWSASGAGPKSWPARPPDRAVVPPRSPRGSLRPGPFL